MEKKIEITEPFRVDELEWTCSLNVDNKTLFYCWGQTPEQAQQNARIAAKGYLVEELVPHLEEFLNLLKAYLKDDSEDIIKLTELLTKAKTV